MTTRPYNITKKLSIVGLAAFVSAAISGCGAQQFEATSTTQSQQSPGQYTVPAQVDILLAENDTGRMFEAYSQLSQQFPAFLTSLQAQGWDYHFVTIPLTTDQPIEQAMASTYDANWGSQWTSPYPGAVIGDIESLSASVFATPGNYTGFSVTPSNSLDGNAPGLENIRQALTNRVQGTGFLRPGALLAVIVLGTNDDTSGIQYCTREDGVTVPCGVIAPLVTAPDTCDPQAAAFTGTTASGSNVISGVTNLSSLQVGETLYGNGVPAGATITSIGTGSLVMSSNATASASNVQISATSLTPCDPNALSLNYYQSQLAAIKGSAAQVSFYAAVAGEPSDNCAGGYANTGTRYEAMASALNGASYDICSSSISSVLSGIGSNLQAQKNSFEINYLFIDQDADPSTIVVTKYTGGNPANAVNIPPYDEHTGNGWTYDGYKQDVYAIDFPVPMDKASGYVVELHGTAKLEGSDTANVTFQPAGTSNSN